MVCLISLSIVVISLVAHEQLELQRAELGASLGRTSLRPVEVFDYILGIILSDRLSALYEVAQFLSDKLLLEFVGTVNIHVEDSLKAIEPLGSLSSVG